MKNLLSSNFKLRAFNILVIATVLFQTGFTTIAKAAPATATLGTSTTFSDVPTDHWAYQYIEGLYNAGITGGCGTSPLRYCPEDPVTRTQMAIFILRGMHGSAYAPSDATGTVFADVPLSAFAVAWVEQFAFDGITAGCSTGNYCPNANVTRAQMAIFLLRGKYGNTYTPPAATGTVFSDVPLGSFADAWIEQLAAEGITGGCGNGLFCPDANVTRAQMAVFLVRTFDLPLNVLPPIIPTTTKILPSTTTQNLSSISNDGSTYTFSQTTQELSELAPGQVIVGEAGPTAPDGFLRKVESVSNNGGEVIVQTQPATLEDAVQQGEISVSQALLPGNAKRAVFADGVQPMVTAAGLNIGVQLNNVVLYDADGNLNTTNDQINANGNVSLTPIFNFKLKIQDYQLKELYYTVTTNQISQLRISSKVSVTAKAEKVLATYPMNSLFLTIGPFPVTLTPVLKIVAGVDGSISASVSAGVTQKLTETAGLSYANNNWSLIQQFSNQFQYDAPTLATGSAIKGYTGAKFQILLYGSVGPDISLNLYLKLEANPLQTPSWKIYAGLEVPAGISIDVFSHVVASYSAVVIDYRILIAQASNCNPGGIISDPANDVSPAHIDVTSLNTTLNGETLQAIFHIRDVPPQLTFYRVGISLGYIEYEWSVLVDVDNNPQTGMEGTYKGAEYFLWAMHYIDKQSSPVTDSIGNVVIRGVWKSTSPYSWQSFGPAALTVNSQSDTITLSGVIPGITSSSRIFFYTYDYNPGGADQFDQSSCSVMKYTSSPETHSIVQNGSFATIGK